MPARDNIVSAIGQFRHPNWTPELKKIALDVMGALEEENPGVYDRGRTDIWAAALIWSVARINWTIEKGSNTILLNEICEILDVYPGTISAKAMQISSALNMHVLSRDFKTAEHLRIIEKLGEEFDDWTPDTERLTRRGVFQMIITSRKKFTRPLKLQVVGLIESEGRKLTATHGYVDFREVRIDQKKKYVSGVIDAQLNAVYEIGKVLAMHGFTIASIDRLEPTSPGATFPRNPYMPSSHYVHFITWYESSPLHHKTLDSMEEAEEIMKQTQDMTPEEMQEKWPPGDRSKAWLKSLDAYEQPKLISLRTIAQALKLDPDCLEAHLCKTGWMEDPEKRIDALEDLLDLGDRVLGVNDPDFEPERWWKHHVTRPYLRAMAFLGFELMRLNYLDEATEVLQEVLELNPDDNLAVRYLLLELALYKKDLSLFDEICRAYPDDEGLIFYYGKAIAQYLKFRNKSKARETAIKAFTRNPHPILLITGEEDPPEDMRSYSRGSVEEGLDVAEFLAIFSKKNMEVINWLLTVFVSAGFMDDDDDGDAKIVRMR